MVAVQHGSDTGKAYAVRYPGVDLSELYQTYYLQPGTKNGYSYYVSSDSKYAIYRNPGRNTWFVGLKIEL